MAKRIVREESAPRIVWQTEDGRAVVLRHGPKDYEAKLDGKSAGYFDYAFKAEHELGVLLHQQAEELAHDLADEAAERDEEAASAPDTDNPIIGTMAGVPVYGWQSLDCVAHTILRYGAYVHLNGLKLAAYPQTEGSNYPDHIGVNDGKGLDFRGELFYADWLTLRTMGEAVDELMALARRWCAEAA